MSAERFAKVLARICWNGAAQRHHLQRNVKLVCLLHGAIWQLDISDCLRRLWCCCSTCITRKAPAMAGHDVEREAMAWPMEAGMQSNIYNIIFSKPSNLLSCQMVWSAAVPAVIRVPDAPMTRCLRERQCPSCALLAPFVTLSFACESSNRVARRAWTSELGSDTAHALP